MKTLLMALISGIGMAMCVHAQDPAVINNTGRGIFIGTRPGQGISFYGADPVIQLSGTGGLIEALQSYGLLSSGSATIPLNLNGGTVTCGSVVSTGTLSLTASGTVTIKSGTASPVGALAAPIGTYYFRTGTAAGIFYKNSGTSTSGWLSLTGT